MARLEEEKRLLRIEMRKRLGLQSEEERKIKSERISLKLKSHKRYQQSECIMIYVSLAEEVQTHEVIEGALSEGKRVAVPYLDKTKNRIGAAYIKQFKEDLEPGIYGILEPRTEFLVPAAPEDIDLVLVPGLGFDRSGNRLGRGKGYYDVFLSELRRTVPSIGIAFDFQLLEQIPVCTTDIRMKFLLTNQDEIECGAEG